MEGVVIGDQYQITERLGSGSFGEIYEVECLDSVETYAIKIVVLESFRRRTKHRPRAGCCTRHAFTRL